MLIARGATVSVCSSKTPDLRRYTDAGRYPRRGGRQPGLVDGSMIKQGAVVIDVGINRLPEASWSATSISRRRAACASRITPVPGGVGRMTVAMLIANTVTAAERSVGITGTGEAPLAAAISGVVKRPPGDERPLIASKFHDGNPDAHRKHGQNPTRDLVPAGDQHALVTAALPP